MKLKINIKPRIVEARTKEELLRKVRTNEGYCISSNYGNGVHLRRGFRDEPHIIRAYNLERHRPVKIQEKTKAKSNVFQGKKGTIRKTKIIKNGFWRAYVYDFKVEILDLFNIKIDQSRDTFKFRGRNNNKDYKLTEVPFKVA